MGKGPPNRPALTAGLPFWGKVKGDLPGTQAKVERQLRAKSGLERGQCSLSGYATGARFFDFAQDDMKMVASQWYENGSPK
jgi:hypothetical protein